MKWENTIETVVKTEKAHTKGQWQIGDALKRDLQNRAILETENIPLTTFAECGDKLGELGHDKYGAPFLARLYHTAIAFSPSDRNPDFGWTVHDRSGTPANFKKVVAALRKMGKKVTEVNVMELINVWAEEAREERRQAAAAAKKKEAAAKADKKKASEDKLAAKDAAARAEAEKRRQAAIAAIDEAKAEIRENGGPKHRIDLDVNTSDVDQLERWAIYMSVTAHTSRMKKEAKKTLVDVRRISDRLSANEQAIIVTGVEEIIALLEQINTVVRPTLTAIEGGKRA